MGAVTNPRITGPVQCRPGAAAASRVPCAARHPTAGQVFQNVKVLGDLPVGEFTRTMLAMTAWVSPKEGCTYCHKPKATWPPTPSTPRWWRARCWR
jgi:photosynthetic reaction center cytochrome c subunit